MVFCIELGKKRGYGVQGLARKLGAHKKTALAGGFYCHLLFRGRGGEMNLQQFNETGEPALG